MESASCLICRRRKIKCDRTPGTCEKCRKFGSKCTYSADLATDLAASHGPGNLTRAGLKRRRVLRSCIQCKRAKAKCSGGHVCERCTKRDLTCLFENAVIQSTEDVRAVSPTIDFMPEWLRMESLPSMDRIRELVDIYFRRIHTVRCMGFLHPPKFMELLEDTHSQHDKDSGLIYMVCALAAPFYCAQLMDTCDDEGDPDVRYYDAGKGWADTAMRCVFSNFGNPKIEYLMTAILLHEYYLRIGEHAKGFLISGMIARHVQILQITVEDEIDFLDQNVPWAIKETKRRLVWACYLLDASIECGIDQLRFVHSTDIQVQLPCSEELFIRNIPCITETLSPGNFLPFIDSTLVSEPGDNLDLRAYYIRIMVIRSKILRYVKHLEGEVPWQLTADSEFQKLNQELCVLESSIPDRFSLTPENIYLLKASDHLNLLFGLHILIPQTFNDLYRIGVSRLVFPNSATKWIRQNAPHQFLQLCHETCLRKTIRVASLLKDLWNCHKPSIVDIPFAVHTQICSIVLVTTMISWEEHMLGEPECRYQDCREILQNNVKILRYLKRYMKVDMYYGSTNRALKRFNQKFSNDSSLVKMIPSTEAYLSEDTRNISQYSLEYVLNPLGTYPIARKQVQEHSHREEGASIILSKTGEAETRNTQSTGPSSIDDILSQDEISFGGVFDWPLEFPFMDNMGYPTYLDEFPLEDS